MNELEIVAGIKEGCFWNEWGFIPVTLVSNWMNGGIRQHTRNELDHIFRAQGVRWVPKAENGAPMQD